MVTISQGSLNPVAVPSRVLLGHSDYERKDVLADKRSAGDQPALA
jgi:hypothetical protein